MAISHDNASGSRTEWPHKGGWRREKKCGDFQGVRALQRAHNLELSCVVAENNVMGFTQQNRVVYRTVTEEDDLFNWATFS